MSFKSELFHSIAWNVVGDIIKNPDIIIQNLAEMDGNGKKHVSKNIITARKDNTKSACFTHILNINACVYIKPMILPHHTKDSLSENYLYPVPGRDIEVPGLELAVPGRLTAVSLSHLSSSSLTRRSICSLFLSSLSSSD